MAQNKWKEMKCYFQMVELYFLVLGLTGNEKNSFLYAEFWDFFL
jgi:hypothetical protein